MANEEKLKRSLRDLLDENEIKDLDKEEVIDIDLEKIKPNPHQPRKHFDPKTLRELADSIQENGVLQPIIVKKIADGHMLVAGERRVKASKLAGFKTIPAIIRDYNDRFLAELALLENIQRDDLTIVEEAEAYQNAIDSLKLTHMELAQKIGKSRSYVSNALGILSLPEDVLIQIGKNQISMGHARALSKLKNTDRIRTIAKKIVDNQLTVRQIEDMVKKEEKKKKIERNQHSIKDDVDFKALNNVIKKRFPSGKVRATGGRIVFSLSAKEDIDTLQRLLQEEREGDGQ